LSGGVSVQNVLELGNRRGDFEAEVEDLLLALKTDILGPPHHAGQVALGLDVLADTIVARTLLNEGVLRTKLVIRIFCFMETALDMDVPWPASSHRPFPEGKALVPSSLLWEASWSSGCH